MYYIIIGAGPAGIVAAENIRKSDADADITLIGSEPEPPYSRMAIPYYLTGNIDESGSYLRTQQNHYEALNISVVRDQVVKVEPGSQLLKLASGKTLEYDKLLIATGSNPIRPPIPGIDLPCVQSCWTLQDGRNIIELAQSGSNVVLIGAGFIGCIILEALVKRGVNLTVVETGNRMVPRMLDDKAGGLLQRWCEAKGVNVKTSAGVTAINAVGNGATVALDNGESFPADLVIAATGVRANIGFLQNSGIDCDQGILVDEFMQTNQPNVYAAGDVAQGYDFSTGQQTVQAIQPTATDHGRIAALNMCGKKTKHHGSINMNVLDTLGLISVSFGSWMGEAGGESVEIYNEEFFQYLNLQFSGDVLVGASATGKTQHVGVMRGLIESRIKLGEWKDRLLQDPTCLMEAYMACTQEIGFNQR